MDPLSKTGEQAWVELLRGSQAALAGVEAALRGAGLPPLVWYDALLELWRAPAGRLRHRELHRRMLLEKYNLTRLIDRMASEGLVERTACPEDGRGAVIAITDEGRALRERMWPIYRAAIVDHFAGSFSAAELETLAGLLARLR